jgi:DNA uptake protein ComE-like DNA-binding protein
VILLLLAALAAQAAAPPAQTPVAPVPAHRELTDAEAALLPPGDGRDAVAFMCVPCHGIQPVAAQRKTALGWAAAVEDMRTKGADGTDAQAEAAAAYLGRHFPAVDVTRATAKEIAEVTGLTDEEARALVAYRDEGHPLKSFADVKKVAGLDPARLTAAKSRIVFAPK